jgi:hypothetical protein
MFEDPRRLAQKDHARGMVSGKTGFGPLLAARLLRNAVRKSGTMLRDTPVALLYRT